MTVIKIPLGYLLAIVLGLMGAGLVFAALFSRDTRFWLIDQHVGGPHDKLVNELIPPTACEQFVLWTGAGVFGIPAAIAIVTAVTLDPLPRRRIPR